MTTLLELIYPLAMGGFAGIGIYTTGRGLWNIARFRSRRHQIRSRLDLRRWPRVQGDYCAEQIIAVEDALEEVRSDKRVAFVPSPSGLGEMESRIELGRILERLNLSPDISENWKSRTLRFKFVTDADATAFRMACETITEQSLATRLEHLNDLKGEP